MGGGRRLTAREPRGPELERVELRAGLGIIEQELLDLGALVVVQRAERVSAQQLAELTGVEIPGYGGSSMSSANSRVRRRINPLRIRLLMVPSGSLSATATWRYV